LIFSWSILPLNKGSAVVGRQQSPGKRKLLAKIVQFTARQQSE
jgi:hypothetical protein